MPTTAQRSSEERYELSPRQHSWFVALFVHIGRVTIPGTTQVSRRLGDPIGRLWKENLLSSESEEDRARDFLQKLRGFGCSLLLLDDPDKKPASVSAFEVLNYDRWRFVSDNIVVVPEAAPESGVTMHTENTEEQLLLAHRDELVARQNLLQKKRDELTRRIAEIDAEMSTITMADQEIHVVIGDLHLSREKVSRLCAQVAEHLPQPPRLHLVPS